MKITFLFSIFLIALQAQAQQTVGLMQYKSSNLDGYVLFSPVSNDTTYLIDKCGKKVHQWSSARKPGLSSYLLSDGSLLKTGAIPNPNFNSNGATGGLIEKIDWNNNLVWSYRISDSLHTQNHDIYPMPNGNILVVVWVKIKPTVAIAAGRNPSLLGTSLWSAEIYELQPSGTSNATIVWQWKFWDHLIQDFDNTKSNYGVVANHSELLNLNFNGSNTATSVDWLHVNAVTYNPTLDQIMISSHNLSEIYIIDHSTTTAQAAMHAGGNHNKGGDFLYRWGNPQAYNHGISTDQKLFQQHNPTWIPAGYKDAGNIMIFNNGVGRSGGNSASVDIIAQPVDANGDYTFPTGTNPFAPSAAYWSYSANPPSSFFTPVMGGAQRLSNGNTIICEATSGNFFEIDSNKNTVWQYINPVGSTGAIAQGTTSTTLGCFRCTLFEPNFAGFTGHSLIASKPIEINPLSPGICDTLNSGVAAFDNTQKVFDIFPNPSNQTFTIQLFDNSTNHKIVMTDVLGRVVFQSDQVFSGTKKSATINVENLPNGIYFIQAGNETKKIIKE